MTGSTLTDVLHGVEEQLAFIEDELQKVENRDAVKSIRYRMDKIQALLGMPVPGKPDLKEKADGA